MSCQASHLGKNYLFRPLINIREVLDSKIARKRKLVFVNGYECDSIFTHLLIRDKSANILADHAERL
jgi:hypothetical protein